MDYLGKSPSINTLIKRGVKNGAYIKNIGWSHKGLVELAKSYDLKGKNYDWFKKTPEEAWQKTIPYFKKYPIIASVYKNFNYKNNGHLIVITGFKNKKVYYNDPIAKRRKEISKKISLKKFLAGWKRRVIIIKP